MMIEIAQSRLPWICCFTNLCFPRRIKDLALISTSIIQNWILEAPFALSISFTHAATRRIDRRSSTSSTIKHKAVQISFHSKGGRLCRAATLYIYFFAPRVQLKAAESGAGAGSGGDGGAIINNSRVCQYPAACWARKMMAALREPRTEWEKPFSAKMNAECEWIHANVCCYTRPERASAAFLCLRSLTGSLFLSLSLARAHTRTAQRAHALSAPPGWKAKLAGLFLWNWPWRSFSPKKTMRASGEHYAIRWQRGTQRHWRLDAPSFFP